MNIYVSQHFDMIFCSCDIRNVILAWYVIDLMLRNIGLAVQHCLYLPLLPAKKSHVSKSGLKLQYRSVFLFLTTKYPLLHTVIKFKYLNIFAYLQKSFILHSKFMKLLKKCKPWTLLGRLYFYVTTWLLHQLVSTSQNRRWI